MSAAIRMTPEAHAAHQAKRAAECAKADGRANEASDSVAEVIPYGAPIKPAKPRDLFGDRLPALLESDVLPSILAALRVHPKVAFVFRQNTGAMKVDGRYIKFAFEGCPDILGMLTEKAGSQFLAIEVKRRGEKPTPVQANFLANVKGAGGCAGVAYSVADANRIVDSNGTTRATNYGRSSKNLLR